MRFEGTPSAKRNVKRLRRARTPPEIALWLALKSNEAGLRFRKQHGAGDYVLDFYCAPAKLVIEIDGEAHNRGRRPERDAIRDAWVAERGIHTLRYAARDVMADIEAVVRHITAIALERRDHFNSPPGGGGLDKRRSPASDLGLLSDLISRDV